jgi:putative flippase GtrA
MTVNPIHRISNAIADFKSKVYGKEQFSEDFVRYFFIACLNSIFMFSVYQLIYWLDLMNTYTAEIAWFFSFIIGTIEAHYVHRRFTFKSTAPYGESLYWVIFVYSIILVLSTLMISSLINTFDIQYQMAWVINNVIFGLFFFAGLRFVAFPLEDASEV